MALVPHHKSNELTLEHLPAKWEPNHHRKRDLQTGTGVNFDPTEPEFTLMIDYLRGWVAARAQFRHNADKPNG